MALAGGMDVGGTKIEAKLFGPGWSVLDSRRTATPTGDYQSLLQGISDQFDWLEQSADRVDIPIGIGVPGLVDHATGHMVIANLPVEGRNLAKDFASARGRAVPFVNDCRAFTLSEAVLGAGRGHGAVLGLVIGTGVAGGLAVNGQLLGARNDAAGEFGHTPIPATLAREYDLPILRCGCGQMGCYETFVSGPGLERLAEHLTGTRASTAQIAGDARVMQVWARLAGAMLRTILLVADPDVIVLGGGLSNIPGLADLLAGELPNDLLAGVSPPPVRLAEGGDASGARGAALMALEDARDG